MEEDLTSELFHACALRAWMIVAADTGQWPPDSERTRRLACRLFESELRAENDRRNAGAEIPVYSPNKSWHGEPITSSDEGGPDALLSTD